MDVLQDVANWIPNHLTELVSLIFAGVVAWSAWGGTKLNRRLAEAELDPFVTIYIEPQRIYPYFLDLVIKNVGRGPARQLTFIVEPDVPLWSNDTHRLTNIAIFRRGMDFLAPSQEIRTFYGTYFELVKDPISIHVSYSKESLHRKAEQVRSSFILDVTQFEGIGSIGEAPEKIATDALKSIAKDVGWIRQGGSWSNVTVTVRRRYALSGPINRRWRQLGQWWQNTKVNWAKGKYPWRRR